MQGFVWCESATSCLYSSNLLCLDKSWFSCALDKAFTIYIYLQFEVYCSAQRQCCLSVRERQNFCSISTKWKKHWFLIQVCFISHMSVCVQPSLHLFLLKIHQASLFQLNRISFHFISFHLIEPNLPGSTSSKFLSICLKMCLRVSTTGIIWSWWNS